MPIVLHNIHRRALHLLFGSPNGCTTSGVLLAHGISPDVVADMADAGLVRVQPVDGGAEMSRVQMTDTGRSAIHSTK